MTWAGDHNRREPGQPQPELVKQGPSNRCPEDWQSVSIVHDRSRVRPPWRCIPPCWRRLPPPGERPSPRTHRRPHGESVLRVSRVKCPDRDILPGAIAGVGPCARNSGPPPGAGPAGAPVHPPVVGDCGHRSALTWPGRNPTADQSRIGPPDVPGRQPARSLGRHSAADTTLVPVPAPQGAATGDRSRPGASLSPSSAYRRTEDALPGHGLSSKCLPPSAVRRRR